MYPSFTGRNTAKFRKYHFRVKPKYPNHFLKQFHIRPTILLFYNLQLLIEFPRHDVLPKCF